MNPSRKNFKGRLRFVFEVDGSMYAVGLLSKLLQRLTLLSICILEDLAGMPVVDAMNSNDAVRSKVSIRY